MISVTRNTTIEASWSEVTGGGGYCPGGAGVHIFLNASVIGIKYQLYTGFTPVGLPINGTGAALDGNVTEPGPILLQGDHGKVSYRNVRIRAIK